MRMKLRVRELNLGHPPEKRQKLTGSEFVNETTSEPEKLVGAHLLGGGPAFDISKGGR